MDECAGNPCGNNAVCINTAGSYDCRCKENYGGNPFIMCLPVEASRCADPAKCPCSQDTPCPSG